MTPDISSADTPPDPTSGWSRDIVELADATVVAPDTAHFRQRCGVFDNDGAFCKHGITWRFGNRMTVKPTQLPEPRPTIPGRWLWGGVLFNHFGHFLVESTSRLWALDHFSKPLSGIVYVNKRPRAPLNIDGYRREFINLLMPDIPVHIVKPAAQFEHLVVPGQGLGLGTISTGTPELRHSFNSRLCAAVEPSGPAKLYVSRSKLSPQSSGILGETTLETQLSNDGYTIFHPQDHSLRSQIAHYRGAEKIIIADGSAGHLVALVCRPDQKIAYIVRRSDWSEGPITQIESFRQKPILTISALSREWRPKDPTKHKHIRFGELNLSAVSRALREDGFLDGSNTWPDLTRQDVEDVLDAEGILDDFSPHST